MPFEKNDSAGYLINHLARIFAQALAREIKPLGLAPGQFMVLLELWREDGLTQRDLVARLDVEQATLANTLSRMERDGLVRRAPAPQRRPGPGHPPHPAGKAARGPGDPGRRRRQPPDARRPPGGGSRSFCRDHAAGDRDRDAPRRPMGADAHGKQRSPRPGRLA